MSQEKYYNLQAIVLRNHLYKEHDKLVGLFSLQRGRFTALARGASRPTGGLRGLTQPFTQVNLSLARGRGSLDIITQGEIERPFISLRQDLTKIAYASYMVELTTLAMPEEKPSHNVFTLLLAAFSLLDMDISPPLASCFFELRLLAALGLAPYLADCMNCGRGLSGSRFALVPARG
ncbi:MAG: DNA repair protein RecO, partial [Clostridiales bacterium]|nr:DNA repair protein RecO [Clostridiales bacterium]